MQDRVEFKRYSILATFDSVIDIDYGIYQFIKFNYHNLDCINEKALTADDKVIRFILTKRFDENLLNFLIKSDNQEMKDKIYHDILINKKQDIISLSKPYDVMRLLITYKESATSLDKLVILCNDEIEVDYIKRFSTPIDALICEKKDVDISKYDIFYIKHFSDILQFRKIEGKTIYLLNMGINYDRKERMIDPKLSIIFSDINQIKLIDPYRDLIKLQ